KSAFPDVWAGVGSCRKKGSRHGGVFISLAASENCVYVPVRKCLSRSLFESGREGGWQLTPNQFHRNPRNFIADPHRPIAKTPFCMRRRGKIGGAGARRGSAL